MKTEITKINNDWIDVKNECRNTVNKERSAVPAKDEFKFNLLISEHSPIRLIDVKWRWVGIKSWIATHFARHWLGWDKWIGTQRDDRTGVDRNKAPQDTPVNYDGKANAQSLINVARYRLCVGSAHKETREYMEDLKQQIMKVEPQLAKVMIPNCIYRMGCPEFQCCGLINEFAKWCCDTCTADRLTNIRVRYELFDTFMELKRKKNE